MSKIREAQYSAQNALLDKLGLTTDIHNIVIEDFEIVGEKEILAGVSFTLKNCQNVWYSHNCLTGEFAIHSSQYDNILYIMEM